MSFIIKNEEVEFNFVTDCKPKRQHDEILIDVSKKAPTPDIIQGDRLILPVDEGIAINVDESYESGEFDCDAIGGLFCTGHKGSVGMVLVERNKSFLAICPEKPAYTEYKAERKDGMYHLAIICHEPCEVVYRVFLSLPKACKWYRERYNPDCLTLSDKIRKNREIEKLVGGAIFWIWNDNYNDVMYADREVSDSPASGEKLLSVADDLYKNGVDNAMFGLFFDEDQRLSELLYKKYGFLPTQYDNYNDVLNPDLLKKIPNNRVKNCGYTYRRMKDYPNGVAVDEKGQLVTAWELKGFDGKMYSQNMLCPICAKKAMKEEIPSMLRQFPYYKGWFVDVFGGSLCECFSKKHPLTREESIDVKNEAFAELEEMGLITGTEDGFDKIIDHIVYTEGLHSPVYFRNKDSGRNHANIYSDEQTAYISKHMINPKCRVPLWHLIYHECVFAFPYWGDSTEMSKEIIRDKVLFACLYGCPPLYSFKFANYKFLRNVILESYKEIAEVHKKTALLPMTDFSVVSDDYMVQRSVFGNKYEITVNFSNEIYAIEKITIPPKDYIMKEIKD